MIRTVPASLVLVVLLCLCSTSAQERKLRSGVVEDITGVKTDVTEIGFDCSLRRFYSLGRMSVVVFTNPFEVAIELSNLKSIKAKGQEYEVTYVWLGKDNTVIGPLGLGTFLGKTELGDFSLSSSKLKDLVFPDPPSTDWAWERRYLTTAPTYVLVLADGRNVAVSDLRRHATYDSMDGYRIVRQYHHYADICVRRGESEVTVAFAKLKTIEFGAEGVVTVTLATGTSATGTSCRGQLNVDGFTGISDAGPFFLAPALVKKVVVASTKG